MLELSVEVGVDVKRLHLLILLDLGRALSLVRMLLLPHTDERRPVIVLATHDVASRREHALDLPIRTRDHLATPLRMVHRSGPAAPFAR